MFALSHLIFMIDKITVLASIYATIILLLARLISKSYPNSDLNRISQKKLKFWWWTGLLFSIGLFFFSFTYWGDHGLGDGSRIPVGHGKSIHNGDGVWTYFYTADNNQKHIKHFQIKDNKLFAEQDDNRYLIYDLQTSALKEFRTKMEYDTYANEHNYPMSGEFKDFMDHYKSYWNGWRFWLLA